MLRIMRRLSSSSRAPQVQKSIQVLENDVVLVSYPRSGNTWMRYLLANLLAPGEDWNITNVGRVVPDIYEKMLPDPVKTSPRILKSHEPFREGYPRVIYLYRDGRDVAVSYYDFYTKLRGYQESFEAFLTKMLHGELEYGTWQDHVATWLFRPGASHIQAVCYEALCQGTRQELERIGDFLGVAWSVAEIETAVARSTFDKFQKDYARHKQETHWRKGFTGGVKGGPGGWRGVFDEALNELFWQCAGDVAGRLGYSKL